MRSAKGLIVIAEDVLLLYRGDEPVRQFTGLEPPLFNKMKTLGHIPLAVFCLLDAVHDGPLSPSLKARLVSYRTLLDGAGPALDVTEERRRRHPARAGHHPCRGHGLSRHHPAHRCRLAPGAT